MRETEQQRRARRERERERIYEKQQARLDRFASAALTGLLAKAGHEPGDWTSLNYELFARTAYDLARRMMNESAYRNEWGSETQPSSEEDGL